MKVKELIEILNDAEIKSGCPSRCRMTPTVNIYFAGCGLIGSGIDVAASTATPHCRSINLRKTGHHVVESLHTFKEQSAHDFDQCAVFCFPAVSADIPQSSFDALHIAKVFLIEAAFNGVDVELQVACEFRFITNLDEFFQLFSGHFLSFVARLIHSTVTQFYQTSFSKMLKRAFGAHQSRVNIGRNKIVDTNIINNDAGLTLRLGQKVL